MEYYIAVFSLRTDTMQFNSLLNRNRIRSTIVETPKSASASCGISVKFSAHDLPIVQKLLAVSGTKSFVKFYKVSGMFGRTTVSPLRYY